MLTATVAAAPTATVAVSVICKVTTTVTVAVTIEMCIVFMNNVLQQPWVMARFVRRQWLAMKYVEMQCKHIEAEQRGEVLDTKDENRHVKKWLIIQTMQQSEYRGITKAAKNQLLEQWMK